ncbi:hypothetical protein V1511DRAFT_508570 [Dipodascopsis uninucleata]
MSIAESEKSLSPILDLPLEILLYIFELLYKDDFGENAERLYLTKRLCLFKRSILPVCKQFYYTALPVLYSHVHIGHPRAFDVFRSELQKRQFLGPMVQCLDFSDFTSIGLGRTRRMNREIQMVTSKTISMTLRNLTNLREFLVSESVEDDIDEEVLTLLFQKDYLESVDFCGASSASFKKAFSLIEFDNDMRHLSRLSFHECSSIPANVFESLLKHLPSVTRLDLTRTHVTLKALMSISDSARITHLSLAKCGSLTGNEIAIFLTRHPAVCNGTLRWLSLHSTRLSQAQLSDVLLALPRHLAHLSLYGLPVTEDHLATLPLGVESLSLGFTELNLESVINALGRTGNYKSLTYLDLTGNPNVTIWKVQDMNLLRGCDNIQTWEFDTSLVLSKIADVVIPGYTIVLGQGRRGWLFKNNYQPHLDHTVDSKSPSKYALGVDMGLSGSWTGASRKIDCSRYGGGLERGIYLYYAYRTK